MAGKYWFNIETHEVEEGRKSDWTKLMGPYATRDEAAHALDKARRRTEAWDLEDQEKTGP
ncbi:SPOR domain-containing protein [Cellulomonas fengjieae]|uniref:SPOR domain-containing protein n=1 Tax=Cellulomonas fengjieae TaxID=2819978 RepID=A0ABS3SE91_9CELL|nr:SPOR domain-containing protein [Cellulomonas fengjieae]MBO3084073.1 SPOR domain-containing protein [Cellulomonas fengjieae]MBO3103678.1 SPOR domain-containing protein [Cellulomonas fengjieae]QVI64671.1 SPOR domain-containing protein [Cellulomonas fengjieae]